MRDHFNSENLALVFKGLLSTLIILIILGSKTRAEAASITVPRNQEIPFATGSVAANSLGQGIQPEIVYAHHINAPCGEDEWISTLEVWNVGSSGGDAYAQATLTGSNCVNGKLDDPKEWYGTFTGGPNGDLFLPTYGYPGTNCHFEDGLYVKCGEQNFTAFIVQNPEAFGETEAEKGLDCFPVISNIDNLKPGDVLSPSIDFVDENGKPVDILGHALFINGVETWSMVWDGKETRLEVQYTCSNHRGDFKIITLPAYQEAPPESNQSPQQQPSSIDGDTPSQPGDSSALQPGQDPSAPPANPPITTLPGIPGVFPMAIGLVGMTVGLAGAAVSGGAILVSVLNTTSVKPSVAKPTPSPTKNSTPQKQAPQKKKEPESKKEKKPERKGLLESEKDALKKYQESLENLSENVEKAIELTEKIRELSPEGREKLQKKLSDFKDSLDKVSKKANDYADKIEMVQDVGEKFKSLGEKFKQIQKAHQEAFKDLEHVPEGAANQLVDLTTAIETFGNVADAALNRIPYIKQIYSDETFEVTKSFKEFATGMRKTFANTIFRTSIEANQVFPTEELKSFSDGRENRRLDPVMQEWFRKQLQKQPKSKPSSVLQQVKDLIFGKEISPEVKSQR